MRWKVKYTKGEARTLPLQGNERKPRNLHGFPPHRVLAISQSPRSSFPGPLAAMLLGVVIVGAPLWLGLWAQNQLSAPTALPFSLLTVTPFTGGFEINSEARVLEARQYPIQYDLL